MSWENSMFYFENSPPVYIYQFFGKNMNKCQVVLGFVIQHNKRSTPNIPRLFGVPTAGRGVYQLMETKYFY